MLRLALIVFCGLLEIGCTSKQQSDSPEAKQKDLRVQTTTFAMSRIEVPYSSVNTSPIIVTVPVPDADVVHVWGYVHNGQYWVDCRVPKNTGKDACEGLEISGSAHFSPYRIAGDGDPGPNDLKLTTYLADVTNRAGQGVNRLALLVVEFKVPQR